MLEIRENEHLSRCFIPHPLFRCAPDAANASISNNCKAAHGLFEMD